MQLKKTPKQPARIAEKLAVAATALIGSTANAQQTDGEWRFSSSVLAYSEPDRVSAAEFIATANKTYGDEGLLDVKIVLDSLTGSSANGAIEQHSAQTFTRPSGKGQFVTQADDTPLDDTFKDTRLQVNASWTNALTEDMRYTIGSNLSREYDYQSITINGEIAKDFFQKNTTLSTGLSFGSDQVAPEGDIPLAFSSMVVNQGQYNSEQDYWQAFDATRTKDSDSITTAELLLGWTQIVNRRMLMQFNYGFSDTRGYLTDPFKVLSVVNNQGITQDLVYENRPDARAQHSIFALTKYHFEASIFDISYRYIADDWDINSHTIDTHWRFMLQDNSFWEPHLRFYQQSAAKFYQPFLTQSQSLPSYASADYRLGDLSAITIGIKYGFQMHDGDRAEVRLEYYKQAPRKSNQPADIARLNELELYPEVDALILQLNYYF
ncbi:MAG: DUF3570 domain-containing protein [Kangiellaceae bacterium]|nr:DUF3570 domain-containing protein [Kangiellaceae bacterium]